MSIVLGEHVALVPDPGARPDAHAADELAPLRAPSKSGRAAFLARVVAQVITDLDAMGLA